MFEVLKIFNRLFISEHFHGSIVFLDFDGFFGSWIFFIFFGFSPDRKGRPAADSSANSKVHTLSTTFPFANLIGLNSARSFRKNRSLKVPVSRGDKRA